jgi:hypothetical protein
MASAETLDFFLLNVLSQDAKKRLETGEELIIYLKNSETSLYCEELDKFIDGLTGWISSSSFKVSLTVAKSAHWSKLNLSVLHAKLSSLTQKKLRAMHCPI